MSTTVIYVAHESALEDAKRHARAECLRGNVTGHVLECWERSTLKSDGTGALFIEVECLPFSGISAEIDIVI